MGAYITRCTSTAERPGTGNCQNAELSAGGHDATLSKERKIKGLTTHLVTAFVRACR